MKRTEIFEKVKEIINDKLCPEVEITEDSTFENLGADSLDTIELIMKIEDEFGIRLPDEETDSVKTVKDLVDIIEKKLN